MRIPWTSSGTIEEECGKDPAYIRAWLDTESDLGESCQITLEELPPREFGTLTLPRCRIVFSGERAACEEMYRRFFLAFVSAGG